MTCCSEDPDYHHARHVLYAMRTGVEMPCTCNGLGTMGATTGGPDCTTVLIPAAGPFLPPVRSDGGVVLPGDVDQMKSRVLARAKGLDLSVEQCGKLSDAERSSWSLFFHDLSSFASQSTSFFQIVPDFHTTCSYANTLDSWEAKLADKCALVVPRTEASSLPGTVKLIAAAAAVVAVVVLIKTYVPSSLFKAKRSS